MAATSTLSKPMQWLIDWIRGPESDSGVAVTVDSVLGYAPVWYAVSKISGHVGQLPMSLHKRLDPRGSEPAHTHPVYRLLKTRPNELQTAIAFREQLMFHALLTGNGRAAIVRRGGVPYELIPLLPANTCTCLVDGKKWHIIQTQSDDRCAYLPGSPEWFRDGEFYKIPDADVLHIPGLSYDGISGVSLVTVARNSFGLGLAAQRAGANSFRHGSKPSVVLTAPNGMFRSDQETKAFLEDFNEYHTGLDNTGKAALMREGMTLSTVPMSASDSQWVEQRLFERQEAALFFQLEQILGDDSSVSYNSLEQKNLAYLQNCLMKWLVKWEQECDWKLLNDRSHRTHYTKFNVDALLRPDSKTKMDTLSLAINARIMNPNEAREKLDMNPYDGGDEFFNPAITPGNGNDQPTPKKAATTEDANRAAIVAQMRHLITVSANNAKDAAGRRKNFVSWMKKYYDDNNGTWTKTFTKAISEFGGHREVGVRFCGECREQLLELACSVPPEGLVHAVSDVVAKWPDRAERLADEILMEVCDV